MLPSMGRRRHLSTIVEVSLEYLREYTLRVLHVIDSLIQAGAEALFKDMVPRMRSAGIDVSIAVLKELDSPFENELRQ